MPGNPLAERSSRRAARRPGARSRCWKASRDEWLALQAGVPLYPAFFGRDAAHRRLAGGRCSTRGAMLDAALTRLGRHAVATDDFDWRDEEPGRHPVPGARSGPLARLGMNPYSAYYADFASPLMYVIALGQPLRMDGRPRR